jgi:hypothetical protein
MELPDGEEWTVTVRNTQGKALAIFQARGSADLAGLRLGSGLFQVTAVARHRILRGAVVLR